LIDTFRATNDINIFEIAPFPVVCGIISEKKLNCPAIWRRLKLTILA